MDDTHSMMCVAPDNATENDGRDYRVIMVLVISIVVTLGIVAILGG